MSSYKKRIYGTLKDNTQKLISMCGGLKRASLIDGIRVKQTQLFKYTDHSEINAFITIDQVLAMEQFCETPIITSELARSNGYGIYKISINNKYKNDYDIHDIDREEYIKIMEYFNQFNNILIQNIKDKKFIYNLENSNNTISLCNRIIESCEKILFATKINLKKNMYKNQI